MTTAIHALRPLGQLSPHSRGNENLVRFSQTCTKQDGEMV